MAMFCIVHLSDLHIDSIEKERPEFGRLRTALIDDLKKLLTSKGLTVDVVAITGDLIDKGATATKFEAADNFINELQEKLNIDLDIIKIVPGNHDFARIRIANHAVETMRTQSNDDEKEIFEHQWQTSISQKCNLYYEFLKGTLGIDSSNFHYGGCVNRLTLSHGTINFVLLDSAWSTTGNEDYENVMIGKWQTEEILAELKKLPESDLTIAMMHHPINWFKPEQSDMLKEFFMSPTRFGVDALLHGHIHEAKIEMIGNPDGILCQLVSGIGYPESEPKKKLSNCRYVVYVFDTDSKKVKCYARRSNDRGDFAADTGLYRSGADDGIYEISYSIIKSEKNTIPKFNEADNFFKQKLDAIRELRRNCYSNKAWDNLKEVLEEERISDEIKAAYYLTAAKWAVEDFSDNKKADAYFEKALKHDSNIDISAFKSLKKHKEKNFDEAITELGEINSDNKLYYLLYTLVYAGRGLEASEYIKKVTFEISLDTRYLLALCYIQAKKLPQAMRETEFILKVYPQHPGYLLLMGQVWYWMAIPEDLSQNLIVSAVVFSSSLFSPNAKTIDYLEKALQYFEQAVNFSQDIDNDELKYHIEENWILTAQFITMHNGEADIRALDLLAKSPSRIVPFSYVVSNGLKMDEHKHIGPITKLVRTSDDFIDHAALLIQATGNWEMLEIMEVNFERKGQRNLWLRLKVSLLLSKKDFKLADDILASSEFESIDKEGIELLYLEKTGDIKGLLEKIKMLSSKEGSRTDYVNWLLLCYRFKAFPQLIDIAKQYLELYPDAMAVELLAEVYCKEKNYKEALLVLDGHLELFPYRKLTIQCRYLKYQALWMCGKIELALENVNELWDECIKDPILLLHRAQLYVQEGDLPRGIATLIDGIDKGVKSFQIYLVLSQLLICDNPDEAFRHAKIAMREYPDLPEVYMNALTIAYRTGNDQEAGEILHKLQEFGGESPLITMRVKDFPEMAKKWSEDSKVRWQYVDDAVIPRHVVMGMENKELAADFYWRWINNSEQTPSRIPLQICYGDASQRHKLNDTKINLFMDYSACLIAQELNLFTKILSSFGKIFVSPRLLSTIKYEIDRIADIQPARIESEKKLLSLIENSSIEIAEINYSEVMNDLNASQLHRNDFIALMLARKYGAKVVDEFFAFETFEEQKVPELKMYQVFPAEVIQALVDKGEVLAESVSGYCRNKTIRKAVVDELLTSNPVLIVDNVFLEELMRNDWLDATIDVFKLIIAKNDIDTLKQNIAVNEKKKELKKLLKRLFTVISDFKRQKKIKYCPIAHDEEAEDPLSQIIYDMFKFGEQAKDLAIWCDDRFATSYVTVGEIPIVSVFEIIDVMWRKNNISKNEYLDVTVKMLAKNVQFHVPSVEYIYHALKQARVDKFYGVITENRWLKVLRRNIADSLNDNSVIVARMIQPDKRPEIYGYLEQISSVMKETLCRIWMPDNECTWKKAASNWLLLHFSDSMCEVSRLTKLDGASLRLTAVKHTQLICAAFSVSQYSRRDYFDWLIDNLQITWTYFPDIKDEVLNEVVDLCANMLSRAISEGTIEHKQMMSAFIKQLPNEFSEACFCDLRISNYLKDEITNTYTFEFISANLPKTEWHKWVDRAVARKAGIAGIEQIGNQKIKITFTGDELWNHAILMEHIELEGKSGAAMYHEPLALLFSSDADTRKQWFKLAESYLKYIDNIEELQSDICSEKNSIPKVEQLSKVLEQSLGFFFARTYFFLQDKEKSPQKEVLFPQNPALFLNCIPNIPDGSDDGSSWLSQSMNLAGKIGYVNMLNILASLPLGKQWDFTTIVKGMIADGFIKDEEVLSWVKEELINTVNPVKQQNVCRLLLGCDIGLSDEYFDQVVSILGSQIEVIGDVAHPKYEWYRLYTIMLKYSCENMEHNGAYKNVDLRNKMLWSYLYADMMVKTIHGLTKMNRIFHSVKVVCDTFQEQLNPTMTPQNPFLDFIDADGDIAHPKKTSLYRTVLGGCLSILSDKNLVNSKMMESLLPLLVNANQVNFNPDNDNGYFEQFLLFDNVQNNFNSYFNQNVKVMLHSILSNWGSNIEVYDPTQLALTELNRVINEELDVNLLLGYLGFLSTQSLSPQIVDVIVKLVQKYRLTTEVNNEQFHIKGQIFASLIRLLPEPHKQNLTESYMQDLTEILSQDLEKLAIVLEIMFRLCLSYNIQVTTKPFVEALRVIMSKIEIAKIPKKFFDTLCYLSFYMPHEVISDFASLRREISRYY